MGKYNITLRAAICIFGSIRSRLSFAGRTVLSRLEIQYSKLWAFDPIIQSKKSGAQSYWKKNPFSCVLHWIFFALYDGVVSLAQGAIRSESCQTNVKFGFRSQNLQGLLVEDNPVAAARAKKLLVEHGCDIDVVGDGEQAVILSQRNRYDFILIDIGLPDQTGFEVSEKIRYFEADSLHRAFIFGLATHISRELRRRALQSDMDRVIIKPLTHERVLDLLAAFGFVV